jgi:hypothetical protein
MAVEASAGVRPVMSISGGQLIFDTRPDEEWYPLAMLIRPIMYLEGEPVQLTKVLQLIKREAPDMREAAEAIRLDVSRWRKSMYYGLQHLGDAAPEDALPTGQHRIEAIHSGPAGAWPESADVDAAIPIIPDWVLADTYFNGEMFHSDGPKAETIAGSAGFTLSAYKQAAQIRTVHSTPFIRRTLELVQRGRTEGTLP